MLVACPHVEKAHSRGSSIAITAARKSRRRASRVRRSNRPGARFCANCGTAFEAADKKLATRVPDTFGAQQKQVTVLFADICGSTELISRMDAEDAKHRAGLGGKHHRQGGDALRRRGQPADGRRRHGPVRRPGGDRGPCGERLLCGLGGARRRRPDGRSCLAHAHRHVQRPGHPAQDRPRRRGTTTLPASRLHIAARLEQQAEPGTILLAPQTASLVTGIASIEAMGRIALKGIAEPVPVFRLLSAADRPSWIVRSGAKALSTFVGRERGNAPQLSAAPRTRVGRPGAGGRARGRCRHGQVAPVARVPRGSAARHVARHARGDHGADRRPFPTS